MPGKHLPAQCEQDEPAAIVEVGGAASHSLKDAGSSGGADVAIEFTPIENWLELEAGTTSLFGHHSTEWDTDLLFKKPWTLSEKVEFMVGIGPEWVHSREDGVTANTVDMEVVLDFMFWPSGKHRFGFFIEPGFEQNFGRSHEHSIGFSAGLLIAIPKPGNRGDVTSQRTRFDSTEDAAGRGNRITSTDEEAEGALDRSKNASTRRTVRQCSRAGNDGGWTAGFPLSVRIRPSTTKLSFPVPASFANEQAPWY